MDLTKNFSVSTRQSFNRRGDRQRSSGRTHEFIRGMRASSDTSQESQLSSHRDNAAFAALLLIVLFVVPVYAYGYYSTHLASTQQRSVIGDLQLRSTSVDMTGLNQTGLSLNLNAVVYNPYAFGATLDAVNYSVYANGHYLGSGQIAHSFEVVPQSSQTLIFPISVGWKSAFETMGSYIADLGQVTWGVKGTAIIKVGGLSLFAPFEFTTG